MKVLDLIKDSCTHAVDVSMDEFQLKLSRYDLKSLVVSLTSYLNDIPGPTFSHGSSIQYLYKQPFTAARLLSWAIKVKPCGSKVVTDKDRNMLLNMMWSLSSSKVFLDRMGVNQEWFFRAMKYHQFKYQGGVDLYAPARFLAICGGRRKNSLVEVFFRSVCGCSVLELASFQLLLILCGQEVYSRNGIGVFQDIVSRYERLLPFLIAYDSNSIVNYDFKDFFSLDAYYADPVFVERPILKVDDYYHLAGPHLCWRAGEGLPYDMLRRNSRDQKIFSYLYNGFEEYVGGLLDGAGIKYCRGSDCVEKGRSAADFVIEDDGRLLAIEVKGGVVDERARGSAHGKFAFDKLEGHVIKAVDQIYKTMGRDSIAQKFGMVVTLRETYLRDAGQLQSLVALELSDKYSWDLDSLPLANVLICSVQDFELLVDYCGSAGEVFDFLESFIESNFDPVTAKSMISQALPAVSRKEPLAAEHLEIMQYLQSIYQAE